MRHYFYRPRTLDCLATLYSVCLYNYFWPRVNHVTQHGLSAEDCGVDWGQKASRTRYVGDSEDILFEDLKV